MGRRIEVPDSPQRALYLGDLLGQGISRRSPNSQLELFDWGIRLESMTLLGRPGDCYEIRYEELAGVGLVEQKLRPGLRFSAGFLPQPLTFLTVDSREILEHLEQRGVPVDRELASLDFRLLERIADHPRALLILLSVVGAFAVLWIAAEGIPTTIGAQVNFQTLRSDLAKVHLPPGYQLIAQHEAGSDCHDGCSLTQTWTRAPVSGRTNAGACSDVLHAMSAAFPGVASDSPVPANDACDYAATVESLIHPGQGKRVIEGIVHTGKPGTGGGFTVKLSAAYE